MKNAVYLKCFDPNYFIFIHASRKQANKNWFYHNNDVKESVAKFPKVTLTHKKILHNNIVANLRN